MEFSFNVEIKKGQNLKKLKEARSKAWKIITRKHVLFAVHYLIY